MTGYVINATTRREAVVAGYVHDQGARRRRDYARARELRREHTVARLGGVTIGEARTWMAQWNALGFNLPLSTVLTVALDDRRVARRITRMFLEPTR